MTWTQMSPHENERVVHTGQLFQMWMPAERLSASAEGLQCNLFDLPLLSPIFTAGICWGDGCGFAKSRGS